MQFANMNRQLGFEDGANRSRMNLLSINKPIAQPNYLGAALSGASTGLSAYSAFNQAGLFQGASGTPNVPIDNSLYKGPTFN
jgi:hypothetical protein